MTDPYRVLVIEDDPDVADYAKTVLEKRGGCVVLACPHPAAAAVVLDQFDPDVVLTDIEMPGESGLQFMGRLRAERPDIPVIVITAHVSVEYAVGALRAQADEFLTKPVSPIDLVTTVLRLAADGRANRRAAKPRDFVLAVGAHPDDIEIGVGGALLAHRAAGDTVVLLTLSRGSRGGDSVARQREALDAAEMLGARLFLEDLPDAHISSSGGTVSIIERIADEVKPTIVYTHSANDRHQDHRAVHEATMAATRGVRTVACYQSPSSTVDFRPSRYVPIDEVVDAKLRLLQLFASQTEIREYLQPDFILATARYWGRYGAGGYVEPLEVIRETSDLSTQSIVGKPSRTGRRSNDD